MHGSNFVSIVILNLDATAAKEITFTRDCSLNFVLKVVFKRFCCGHSIGVLHLCMP